MSIYFTRHGQTDWNKAMIIQGQIEVPLNKVGIAQAKEVALRLKDVHLDRIYASPLTRAIDTAKIINEYHHVPLEIDARILEQYYGDLEGKPRSGDVYLSHRHTIPTRYPGGEGYFDVVYRVYDFLHQLEKERPNEDILIVAHGGMARVFHSYFVDMDNDTFTHYGMENCAVATYEWPKREIPSLKGIQK